MGPLRPFQIAIRRLSMLGIAVFLGQLSWEFVPSQIRDLIPASDTLSRVGLFFGVTVGALLLSDAIVKFLVLAFDQGDVGVPEFKETDLQPQESRERPRVLLIEPDTATADEMSSWLEAYEVEVLRACSGMPGFWAAVYGDPDVIVCGHWLPEQDSTGFVPEAAPHSSVLSIDNEPSEGQQASWVKLYDVEVSRPSSGRPGFWAVADADSDVIQCGQWKPEKKELSYIDRLQSHPRTFDIPLILMTCADIKGLKRQAKEMGVAACLQQPVETSELLRELQRHIVLQPRRVRRDKPEAAVELPRMAQQCERVTDCDPVLGAWEPSVT